MRARLHTAGSLSALLIVLFGLSANAVRGQALDLPSELSFEDARAVFLERNVHLRAAWARAEHVRAESRASVLWPNPSLLFQRNQTSRPDGGAGTENTIAVTQPLRYPGEQSALGAVAGHRVSATDALLAEDISSLYAHLRVIYVRAVAARERFAVHERTTSAVREAVQIGEVRLQEGDISPFEQSRLKVALAEFEDDLEQARVEYRDSRIELAYFLTPVSHAAHHEAEETLLSVTDSLSYRRIDPDYQTLVNAATERRGLLAAAEFDVLADEKRLDLEKVRQLPDLGVTAGYRAETQPGAVMNGFTVGLQMGLPVFHRRGPQVTAARAGVRAARHEAELARTVVELDVHEAYESVVSHQTRIERISDGLLKSAGSLLEDALFVYEEGEIGLVELLDAIEAAKSAWLLRIRLVAGHAEARFELDRAIGVLPPDPTSSN